MILRQTYCRQPDAFWIYFPKCVIYKSTKTADFCILLVRWTFCVIVTRDRTQQFNFRPYKNSYGGRWPFDGILLPRFIWYWSDYWPGPRLHCVCCDRHLCGCHSQKVKKFNLLVHWTFRKYIDLWLLQLWLLHF